MPIAQDTNPTVADVARECGVGVMTVSRVVNGGKYVSAETAARVRAAILKLGYQPNEAARILKGRAPRTIGLIVPDLADPFFSVVADAVQQLAARHGYMTLLVASEREPGKECEELSMLKSRNIAGIVIVPSSSQCVPQLKEMQGRGVPVVMLDRSFPGVRAGEVMVENEQGAQSAVDHLVGHGHRRIACIGYDRALNSVSKRIAGYRKTMKRAGLSPHLAIVEHGAEVGPKVLKELRAHNPPTAFFSLNNVTTASILHALQIEHIHIPGEVALIGFDDLDMASLLAVPVTAVRQPAAELGRSATHVLLDLLSEERSSAVPAKAKVILPTELVIRRSCGCDTGYAN